jgi:starch synthase
MKCSGKIEKGKESANTGNLRVVGVVDGPPFDHRTWSGASCHFFSALKRNGYLVRAFSGLPSSWVALFYKCINLDASLEKWKFRYHLDTRFYRRMRDKTARELEKIEETYNHLLQINVWFDTPSIVRGRGITTSAYESSNLVTLMKSPFGYPKVSRMIIDRAMDYERRVYDGLDYIFTRSEWVRNSFIEDFGVSKEKVINVGTGVNLDTIPPAYAKDYDNEGILFIGTDFQRKGGENLLEAFGKVKKKFPRARLTIIGVNLNDIPDGVQCLGFLDQNSVSGRDKVIEAYRNSSIFVMPSLYEPFGNVFLEAMAFMVPCIGTETCAMPEIIEHEKTGLLVPVGNSARLADGIIELLSKPDILEKMGKRAYERVTMFFNWDKVAERIGGAILGNVGQ